VCQDYSKSEVGRFLRHGVFHCCLHWQGVVRELVSVCVSSVRAGDVDVDRSTKMT